MDRDEGQRADEGRDAPVRRYLQELEGAFPRWWDDWAKLRAHPEDVERLERLYREIRRLRERAGSYGLFGLSHPAAALERRLRKILEGRVYLTKPVWEKVSALLSKLELGFLAAVREHNPEVQEALRRRGEEGRHPPRVLYVDDDPTWLRLLRRHLEEMDLEVHTLSDPTRVLDALRQIRPRFLLINLDMPGVEDLELCRRVRADRAFDETVIFLLTAREDVPDRAQCEQAGINEFCSKILGPVGIATRLQLYTNPVRYYLAASLSDN